MLMSKKFARPPSRFAGGDRASAWPWFPPILKETNKISKSASGTKCPAKLAGRAIIAFASPKGGYVHIRNVYQGPAHRIVENAAFLSGRMLPIGGIALPKLETIGYKVLGVYLLEDLAPNLIIDISQAGWQRILDCHWVEKYRTQAARIELPDPTPMVQLIATRDALLGKFIGWTPERVMRLAASMSMTLTELAASVYWDVKDFKLFLNAENRYGLSHLLPSQCMPVGLPRSVANGLWALEQAVLRKASAA
jgi:hypothetical protein